MQTIKTNWKQHTIFLQVYHRDDHREQKFLIGKLGQMIFIARLKALVILRRSLGSDINIPEVAWWFWLMWILPHIHIHHQPPTQYYYGATNYYAASSGRHKFPKIQLLKKFLSQNINQYAHSTRELKNKRFFLKNCFWPIISLCSCFTSER